MGLWIIGQLNEVHGMPAAQSTTLNKRGYPKH